MRECTGKEITEEWLYHLGVPTDQIEELATNSKTMRTYNDAIHHCLLHATYKR